MSDTIRNFRKKIEKDFAKNTIVTEHRSTEFYSTGVLSIDMVLGGGWAKGRIVSLSGWESSGKTTVAILSAIEVQKTGRPVVYIDHECAFDQDYAADLGLDMSPEMFILLQPSDAEDGVELVREAIKVPEIGMIILDSVASMTPRVMMDAEAGDQKMGVLARLLSTWLKVLVKPLEENGCTLLLLNQFREKIGVMYGNPVTLPGGNAIKFFTSQMAEITKTGQEKDGDDVLAQKTRFKVTKNKVAPPFKKAEFLIRFGTGVDKEQDVLDVIINSKFFEKRGSWVYYNDEKVGQGAASVPGWLEQHPDEYKKILDELLGRNTK